MHRVIVLSVFACTLLLASSSDAQQQQWGGQQPPYYNQWNGQQQAPVYSQQQQQAPVYEQQQTQNYNQQLANWRAQQQQVLDTQQRVVQQQQTHALRNQQQGNPQSQVQTFVDGKARLPGSQQDAPVRPVIQSTTSSRSRRPSTNVASQGNEESFKRGRHGPWEGESDAEYTKSQEAGMVAPTVPWKVKRKKYQVPFKIDPKIKFSGNDLRSIRKHLQAAARRMKVNFKARDYETYYLVISTLQQCTANSLRRQYHQNHNEIPVCLDNSYDPFNEIYRATVIGFQVNEKISVHESSEESDGEVNDEESNDESESGESEGDDESEDDEEHDESDY